MALEYNGQRIGAMQYNGVTIGEAMIDGQIVYRSVITVTPVAPTFHDGEPWITLPTVEGVTYSVDGTPGAGQSVTVTATADDGYELDGQTTWGHEYPSAYPISGEWSGQPLNYEVVASHTITEPGTFTIRHEIAGPLEAPWGTIRGPWGTTEGSSSNPSVAEVTHPLTPGDLIEFTAGLTFRIDLSGTWSVTPV